MLFAIARARAARALTRGPPSSHGRNLHRSAVALLLQVLLAAVISSPQ